MLDISDTEIVHFGVKGMKWGVRKKRTSDSSSSSSETQSTGKKMTDAEIIARRKKIVTGAAIAAGVLAAAGTAYVVYDRQKLKGLKDVMTVGERNFENIRKSPEGDRLIRQGAEFTRRSFLSNAAWPTELRTYAVEGADNDLISKYGNKVYKFQAAKDVRIAGLTSQMNILRNPENSKALRKSTSKELAKASISGRRYVEKILNNDQFAKLTIESLRRSAWDGGETGSQTAKTYADLLKRFGYHAVNDLNLPGTGARVLLDSDAFLRR